MIKGILNLFIHSIYLVLILFLVMMFHVAPHDTHKHCSDYQSQHTQQEDVSLLAGHSSLLHT